MSWTTPPHTNDLLNRHYGIAILPISHTQEYNKQKMLELQRFVLSRQTTDTRNELYEHMVVTTIFQHGGMEKSITDNDLKKKIEKDFGIEKIPDLHLKDAIGHLIDKKALSRFNSKLVLAQIKHDEIKQNIQEIRDLEDRVQNNIFESMRKKIPSISDQQCKKIIKNLSNLFGTIFAEYGSTSARILTEGINRMSKLKSQDGFQLLYEKLILCIVAKEARNDLDEFFNDYFGNPTEDVAKFLFSKAQSYVYFEILNLDPDLKSLEQKSWSQKQIYLDTNAFMDLIFEGSTMHNTIETLVNETRELGATVLITDRTGSEFITSIENSRHRHKNFQINKKFVSFYESAQKSSQFLSTYSNELIKNPGLTIDTFLKRYQEFESVMESKYCMVLEEADEEIDLESEDAQRLKNQLLNRARYKRPEVVDHDAYVILRVRKLRDEKPDLTGHKAWMLTTDRSLALAERDVYGKNSVYASVMPEIWLEIISPFVSPQVTITDRSYAFTKLLSTNFNSHKISLNSLSTLLSAFWNTEGIDEKHLEVIIGNDFIKEQLSQIQKSIDEGEDPPLEKIKPMLQKGLKLIQEDFDQKLHKATFDHKQELSSMQRRIDDLKTKVADLTTEKTQTEKKAKTTTLKYKYIILAIIGSAIVDVTLYLWLNTIPDLGIEYMLIPVLTLLGIEVSIVLKIIKP